MTGATIPAHVMRPARRVPRTPSRTPAGAGDKAPPTALERRLAALASATDPAMLTRSPARMRSNMADTDAAPVRPGGEQALTLPSRIGDTLRYRDGRVTDMAGAPVQLAT